MTETSKHQRIYVLTYGATADDIQQLQSLLSDPAIQWQNISASDFAHLRENVGKVDCILLRWHGNLDSLEHVATLRSYSNSLPIIVYGSHWQVQAVVQAMKLGATEVCEFPDNASELLESFKRCTSQESRLQAHFSNLIPKSILARLTSEEARILHLLVQGRTTKEVGATLDISIRTVHYRKRELLRKLGVQNRSEAIELIRLSTNNYLTLGQYPL